MPHPEKPATLPGYDVLRALARSDPRALDELRERLTESVIANASTPDLRRRLEGLKFRIDMERRRASDPMQACIRISAMMHRSFADLRRALEAPDVYLARRRRRSAILVSFPAKAP